MRYLERMNVVCDVCGLHRRKGDHTECSKKRQVEAKNQVKRKANKKMTKTSHEYFEAMLKRIGE